MAANKFFSPDIAERAKARAAAEGEVSESRGGNLARRADALSALTQAVDYAKMQWVDPGVCRPSAENARDYDALTHEDCRELIESIKSEGRQRMPAIVRRAADGSHLEIVTGNRRHWSISWLRANNYPDFQYLVEIQKLDDEAAFRLSDLENRARADVTDLERGRSYLAALGRHYGGDIEQMAARLSISSRNLRRYFDLANLDEVILEALGGYRAARVAHAVTLKAELGKSVAHRDRILNAASRLAAEQGGRRNAEQPPVPAADVVRQLVKAGAARRTTPVTEANKPVVMATSGGVPFAEIIAGTKRTAATLRFLPGTATLDELRDAALRFAEEVHARRSK